MASAGDLHSILFKGELPLEFRPKNVGKLRVKRYFPGQEPAHYQEEEEEEEQQQQRGDDEEEEEVNEETNVSQDEDEGENQRQQRKDRPDEQSTAATKRLRIRHKSNPETETDGNVVADEADDEEDAPLEDISSLAPVTELGGTAAASSSSCADASASAVAPSVGRRRGAAVVEDVGGRKEDDKDQPKIGLLSAGDFVGLSTDLLFCPEVDLSEVRKSRLQEFQNRTASEITAVEGAQQTQVFDRGKSSDGPSDAYAAQEEEDEEDDEEETSDEDDDDDEEENAARPLFIPAALRSKAAASSNGGAAVGAASTAKQKQGATPGGLSDTGTKVLVSSSKNALSEAEEKASIEISRKLLQETVERTREEEAARQAQLARLMSSDPNDMPSDEDGKDDAAEYAAWKVRELERVRRNTEEKLRKEELEQELERRRNMTDRERELDNQRIDAAKPQVERGKYVFLQKYYHRGAFFQDLASEGKEELYLRNFNAPTVDDAIDRKALPKPMQLRRGQFGQKSRVKHTHLADVDTTDHTAPWGHQANVDAKKLQRKHKL